MRLLIILLASFSLTACSMIPESWKFDTEFWTSEEESVAAEEKTVETEEETVEAKAAEKAEAAKEIVLELDADQLAKVEVGKPRTRCLRSLGHQLMLMTERLWRITTSKAVRYTMYCTSEPR